MRLRRLARSNGKCTALLSAGLVISAALLAGTSATASGIPSVGVHVPTARMAKVEPLNETLSLNITKIKGNTIYASGHSTGTVSGTGVFYLTLVNASHAKAEMNGSNSKGSVHCAGAANYRVSGAVSYFSGTVTSFSGSHGYAHARNLGITFTGSLNRTTYEASVKLHGKWES